MADLSSMVAGTRCITTPSQRDAVLGGRVRFRFRYGCRGGATGCNNNWSTWFVGSRTQWNVSKTFYMGVDVMYEELNSASTGSAGAPLGYAGGTSAVTALGNATGTESHSSNWTVRFRAHKDFLP